RRAHAIVVEASGSVVARVVVAGVALLPGAAQALGENADGLAHLARGGALRILRARRVLVEAVVALHVAHPPRAAGGGGVAELRVKLAGGRVLRGVAERAARAVELGLALVVAVAALPDDLRAAFTARNGHGDDQCRGERAANERRHHSLA